MNCRFSSLLSRPSVSSNVSKLLVRWGGGGGGRPGKRRTFNWKEKRILGLDKPKAKTFEEVLRPTGRLADIEPFFNEAEGDYKIDITDLDDFNPPDYAPEVFNDKKKVQVSMLFGSQKGFGMFVPSSNKRSPNKYSTRNRRFSAPFLPSSMKKEEQAPATENKSVDLNSI